MLVLRDPATVSAIADPVLQRLVEQRFEDICAGDEYDTDLHSFMILAEPGDTVQLLEKESGCPILRCYIGTAQYGDPGFRASFECLEEHNTCYEMVFVPNDGDFGIIIFIPKQQGIDAELLAFCAEYATPAP